MLLAHGSYKKTNPTTANTGNSGLLEFLNTCTWCVCFSWDFKKLCRVSIQFRAGMIPITRNTGLRGHQQLCPPAQTSNNTDREWGRPSVAVSIPTDLWVSSLLKWPGWLNALCEYLRAMRAQGYLQTPQHSCGDTATSVAVGPLCNFTSSQTQQEVQARSSVSPAILIISAQ